MRDAQADGRQNTITTRYTHIYLHVSYTCGFDTCSFTYYYNNTIYIYMHILAKKIIYIYIYYN